jgi:nucleoid-associated protein YgaU
LFDALTSEHPFDTLSEQMYATGYGIRPLRSTRRASARRAGRIGAVLGLVVGVSASLAVVAHGGTSPVVTTVVVQPGDTIWSIAVARYPTDDIRARVDDIERANGLNGPSIEAGETLRLPD